ncbi:MAG: hypothetical protein EA389_04065 [Ilumatobacter sp.]|nr:MAG: hypothetical protein EA389_04065 [Ilumatobacter sp.]
MGGCGGHGGLLVWVFEPVVSSRASGVVRCWVFWMFGCSKGAIVAEKRNDLPVSGRSESARG